jgi:hypothetical protein
MHRSNPSARAVRALVLLAAAAAAACGDSSAPPAAGGVYTATLSAPAGHANGAALIELSGAGIDTVTAVDAQVFMQRAGDAVRVAVIADEPGALRFALTMRQGSRLPRANVLEVSDAADALRTPLSGYSVSFRQ